MALIAVLFLYTNNLEYQDEQQPNIKGADEHVSAYSDRRFGASIHEPVDSQKLGETLHEQGIPENARHRPYGAGDEYFSMSETGTRNTHFGKRSPGP